MLVFILHPGPMASTTKAYMAYMGCKALVALGGPQKASLRLSLQCPAVATQKPRKSSAESLSLWLSCLA